MARSDTLYKIGKFFGGVGGQDAFYKRNLGPELKAVPDEEVENPINTVAKTFKKAQMKQAIFAFLCCFMMAAIMIAFSVWIFTP
nr:hypothetical protein [Candidatus Sigynarchaeota archaeon]